MKRKTLPTVMLRKTSTKKAKRSIEKDVGARIG
jgi:hypothetical protein